MKIVFDNIIYSKELQGGVSNYWYEVTSRAMGKPDYECHFYEETHALNNLCRQQLNIPSRAVIPHSQKSLTLARLSALQLPFDDYYLYHSSYYRGLKNKKTYREITTVHDFTHDLYSPVHKKVVHNYLKYGSIKRADGIICVSQNTCNDLYKAFGPLRAKEVAVIHNGVSNDYHHIDTLSRPDAAFIESLNVEKNKFLLYVGARTNYKNFPFVLSLLEKLPELKLVVVGNPLKQHEFKAAGTDVQSRIFAAGNIDNYKLNLLYNNALCLIYPSSYEGFGIPVIEAMRAGCPVAALNASSIPEIAGSAAMLFNGLQVNDFAGGVLKLKHADYKAELISKGLTQSEKFSWDKCSQETFDFYSHIYNL